MYPPNAQHVYDEPSSGSPNLDQPHIKRRVDDILHFSQPGKALDIGWGRGKYHFFSVAKALFAKLQGWIRDPVALRSA
jgi:hypothetical protein